MALKAIAKAENVIRSLQNYVQTQLGATFQGAAAGDRIDWGGGVPFNDADLPEWLQPRLLAAVRPDGLRGPRDQAGDRGNELHWLYNLNIFVRPHDAANNFRILTLRDTVLDAFKVGTGITVTDYAGDSSTLGVLFSEGPDEDRPIVDPQRAEELLQHNLVIPLRWVEGFS